MSQGQIIATVAAAIEMAGQGVDYTPKSGAVCPWCGKDRIPVYCTKPWSGDVRIRYHHCNNPECILYRLNTGIKSLQENH
ncbi:MAG: hypothetical protein M0P69_03630 [Bacteroidales bacterium]|nr:hypothetical protein [Bacteroidales bacterium]